tara:strand:+ start:209 stop:766 length:558 start_codon:yes stop_codon:yes gene_type:complete
MSTVSKIDGLDGNNSLKARFIDVYIYSDDDTAVTYAKGDCLAIEFNVGANYKIHTYTAAGVETDTDAASYLGYGNMYTKAAGNNLYFGAGILAETPNPDSATPGQIPAGTYQKVSMQVSGICSFAKLVTGSCTLGATLIAADSGSTGQLVDYAAGDIEPPFAVNLLEGDNGQANSTVILLNPLSL